MEAEMRGQDVTPQGDGEDDYLVPGSGELRWSLPKSISKTLLMAGHEQKGRGVAN